MRTQILALSPWKNWLSSIFLDEAHATIAYISRSGLVRKKKSLMDIHVRLWLHLRTCNGSNFLSSTVQLYVILIIDLCPNSIFGIDGPAAWWMNIMKWVIHHCINGFFFWVVDRNCVNGFCFGSISLYSLSLLLN